ncbi:MAG: GNAT family N-acetyltransferase [Parachlamydiales bacterium]
MLGTVCNEILHSLPEWFGIEKSIQNYILEVEKLSTFVACSDEKIIGFLSLKIHNSYTSEICVMGIKKDFHRKGVGKRLLQKAEEYLKKIDSSF